MPYRKKANGEDQSNWYKKGRPKPLTAGRARGTPNKITTELKRAVLEAAAMVGRDGRGKGGLHGYLMRIAIQQPKVYCRLIEKLLPMQIKFTDDAAAPERYETVEELRLALAERGLPPPSKIIDITPTVDTANKDGPLVLDKEDEA